MAAVPGLASDLRGRLTYLDARMDGVQVLPTHTAPPRWRLTRLNAHYAPALRLAELVLRHQSVEPGPGGTVVAAFVVTMATVFEDFVTVALREALAAYPGHTDSQHRTHLDEHRAIAIRPDVVHLHEGRVVAVFDAKYKLADQAGRAQHSDAYQMLAYCTSLQVSAGWLVYAHGALPQRRHRVRHTTTDIVPYPLDLAAPPAALLRQVTVLAEAAVRAGS